MATVTLDCTLDAWYCLYNNSRKANGTGPRLQLGYAVDAAGNTYVNRIGLSADASPIPSSAVFSQVLLKGTVRGSNGCFGKGGAQKFWVERTLDPEAIVVERTEPEECVIGGSGGANTYAATEAGGALETTTTNRVKYEGSPAVGDRISVDITALWNAWWPLRDTADPWFTAVLKAADATTGYDETNTARRVAFHAYNAGNSQWFTIEATYSTNATPAAPSVNLLPANGARVPGEDTRVFEGDFTDADTGDQPDLVHIVVATSNAVDGNGKLTTGVVHDSNAAMTGYNLTTKRWTATRAFAETRGTTYYWVCAVTDSGSPAAKSPWSTVRSYTPNRLPTVTKTRPT
jgi:hypothetical protein